MRVAVMSDIHGFSLALDTVLADLDQQGPFDAVVVAGDLAEVGPDPAGVIATLQSRDLIVTQGNTDRDVVEAITDPHPAKGLRYVLEQIGPAGVAWLAELPFSHRITPPGGTSPDDDLLVVHANPHDQLRAMAPNLSERELQELIGDTQTAAIAFGHIHIAYQRQFGEMLLLDVSAVGNPKDGDLRAKYGILTWDEPTRRWTAELRRLEYPLAETIDQIMSSDLPNPAKTRRKLEQASY